MMFYHGTMTSGIAEFNANSKTHDGSNHSVVYITPNRAYALFYIRDIGVNHVTCVVKKNGIIQYDERFKNQLKSLYTGVSGYLYKFSDNNSFEITSTNDVCLSKKTIIPDCVEYVADVYEEILNYEQSGKVEISKYETLTDEQKQDNYDCMVCSIYKNLNNYKDTKIKFLKSNFPNEWDYVQNNPDKRQDYLDIWEKKRNPTIGIVNNGF